jgi:hypothetical protein
MTTWRCSGINVRSLTVGAQLLGAVVAGLLASAFGTGVALLVGAIGMVLAPAWLIRGVTVG